MVPGTYKLTVYRGGTWPKTFTRVESTGEDLDFSVYDNARMQIRAAYKKESSKVIAEYSMDSGHITVSDDGLTLLVTITAAETKDLTFNEGKYEIELIIDATTDPVAAEIVHKFMVGNISVIGEAV